MTSPSVIASELGFPEGPIALASGDVIVVEMFAGKLTRVHADGKRSVVATLGGGPNGAAIGPDGRCYVCNNGGVDAKAVEASLHGGAGEKMETHGDSNGCIQVIDIDSGTVETLYRACGTQPLLAPNDLVFDRHGGFYFTDLGKGQGHLREMGAVYYATPDGKSIRCVIPVIDKPNGVGLSPDEKTLYVAQTEHARLWAFQINEPGVCKIESGPTLGARLVAGLPGMVWFDSLAVEADGRICVGTLLNGGITVVTPDGNEIEHVPMPDMFATNICFGGGDLRTAYITLSGSGRLVQCEWPRAGLRLNYSR
jgi:gluconolactonase